MVIVPELLRQKGEFAVEAKPKPKKPPKSVKPKLSEDEAVLQITRLARNGRKIEAMKLYRETYPVGLREAKDAIEQTATGLPLPIPDVRWEDEEDLPLEAAEEITHMVALGRLEEAAHLYRVTFGTSHVEANTAVQQLVEGKSIDVARRRARKESQETAVRREPDQPTPTGSSNLMVIGVTAAIVLCLTLLLGLLLVFVF